MNKNFSTLTVLVLSCSLVQAGYLGSQLSYNAGFSAGAVPFAAGSFGSHYGAAPFAAPLPVTSFRGGPHPYSFGYSSPPVIKFRRFGPFTTYGSGRSHHKFAYPAAVPSVYDIPPGVAYDDSPPVLYNDYPEDHTVVKFGPPITTTTTTYSTTAAVAAPVAVANSFNRVSGW